jgi:hypothetical protein
MRAYLIGTRVNSVKNDDAGLIEADNGVRPGERLTGRAAQR